MTQTITIEISKTGNSPSNPEQDNYTLILNGDLEGRYLHPQGIRTLVLQELENTFAFLSGREPQTRPWEIFFKERLADKEIVDA